MAQLSYKLVFEFLKSPKMDFWLISKNDSIFEVLRKIYIACSWITKILFMFFLFVAPTTHRVLICLPSASFVRAQNIGLAPGYFYSELSVEVILLEDNLDLLMPSSTCVLYKELKMAWIWLCLRACAHVPFHWSYVYLVTHNYRLEWKKTFSCNLRIYGLVYVSFAKYLVTLLA